LELKIRNLDLTVIIGTCDAYSPLWDNFVTLFDRYWQAPCEKIFVSENKYKKYKGYEFHLPGADKWSNRILSGLNNINTEYTVVILEDYYFIEKITKEEIEFHINFIEEFGANKVMMDYRCPNLTLAKERSYRSRAFCRLSARSNYLTSLQPSIWKTSHLISCMHKNWSPWDFEVEGTRKISGTENKTYLMLRNKKPYWNAVRKGMIISSGWPDIKKKEQLKEIEL